MQRREDRGIHLLADADDHHIAVLDAGLRQRFFVEALDDVRIFRVLADLPHLFLILIQNEQVGVCLRELHRERIPETAEADNTVCFLFLLRFIEHFHFLLHQPIEILPSG